MTMMQPTMALPCGHSIRFGACGEGGAPGEITHQKDQQMVPAYQDLFGVAYPTFAPKSILEIGVCRGGSLAIWREMFPACERIIGVDNNLGQVEPWTREHFAEDSRIQMHHVEMPSEEIRGFGTFDLIIDDGGHGPKAVFPAFELCWPMLNVGGLYVVEDWHHDFHEPERIAAFLVRKMIGGWTEPMPAAGAPFKATVYRAFWALEKRS